MEKFLESLWQRVTVIGFTVAFLAIALLPMRVLAEGEFQLDVGHGGGREGDPLDTNDAGGDDGTRDDIEDTAGSSRYDLFGGDIWSSDILLVPQFDGTGLITFRIIFLSAPVDLVEGSYEK